jgi:uncharacterized membrane protein
VYELYLAVHILCAVLWVGGGVSVHILGRWVANTGDPERMVAFNRDAVKIGNVFYAPLAVVLIVVGVLLVEEVGYEYSELWIALGFLGWLFSLAVGLGVYAQQARKLEAAVVEDGSTSVAAQEGIRRILLINSIQITVLVLVVIDMAIKPA